MEYDSYSRFLSVIQDAWHGHYDLDQFRKTLRSHQTAILRVAEIQPNPAHRQQIESQHVQINEIKIDLRDAEEKGITNEKKNENQSEIGTATGRVVSSSISLPSRSRDTVNYLLDVSVTLSLNELECVFLLLTAAGDVSRFGSPLQIHSSSLPQLIQKQLIQLYFNRRMNLLTGILDLVLMNQAESGVFPDDLLTVVDEFIQELIREKFVSNLIQAIRFTEKNRQKINTSNQIQSETNWNGSGNGNSASASSSSSSSSPSLKLSNLAPELRKRFDAEVLHEIRILYSFFRKHEIESSDAVDLIQLLQERTDALSTHSQIQSDSVPPLSSPFSSSSSFIGAASLSPSSLLSIGSVDLFVCYLLATTFVESLEVKIGSLNEAIKEGAGATNQTTRRLHQFVEQITEKGQNGWNNSNKQTTQHTPTRIRFRIH